MVHRVNWWWLTWPFRANEKVIHHLASETSSDISVKPFVSLGGDTDDYNTHFNGRIADRVLHCLPVRNTCICCGTSTYEGTE